MCEIMEGWFFGVCVMCTMQGGVVHGSGVKGGRYRDTFVVMCSD